MAPVTRSLATRDGAHVWHPYTQMLGRPEPIGIVRGAGVWLETDTGARLLDGISSWWVNIHGHAHPVLAEAIAAQARTLEQVIFANCTHEPAVALAEALVAALPVGLTRVFYSDNGSTAVEAAMKMASQYWSNQGRPRHTFVTLHHAYHGDTVGAMSASEASVFTAPFDRMLFRVVRAQAPYCYRCPLGLARDTCGIACLGTHAASDRLDVLAQQLAAHDGDVAAVLIEPMLQGAGGMIMWPAEFLAGVRRLCDAHGTLLIADEVLTGFGRTGPLFACEHAGITPDIICLSKALTAGFLPMGVTVATDRIYEAFLSDDRTRTFFHGHSYTANPLACAVARASLALLGEREAAVPLSGGAVVSRWLPQVRALHGWLESGLSPLRSHPHVGEVRVLGGVGVVELVSDRATKHAGGYLDGVGPRIAAACLSRGLLVRPLGHVVYLMPPYVITEAEAGWACATLREVMAEVVG